MSAARVVVVGAGKMGAHHARVFALAAGAELRGVLDVDRARAERVARERGVPALRTFDEALEHADLVVIATPTSLHFSQAMRAIDAGRAVLVEKPIAAGAAEAAALCEAAEARGAALLVGHSERFNPVIRALVRETATDRVLSIATRRTAAAPAEELCTNLAVHDINLVALLARSPAELVASSGTADEAEILLRAGSSAAQAHVARGVTRRIRSIRLQTDCATYQGDLVVGQIESSDPNLRPTPNPGEPLALQAAAAIAAIFGESSAVARGRDGLSAVAIAERASAMLAAAAAE